MYLGNRERQKNYECVPRNDENYVARYEIESTGAHLVLFMNIWVSTAIAAYRVALAFQ